jgi:hypothetical protein
MNTTLHPSTISDIIRDKGILQIDDFLTSDEVSNIRKDLLSIFSILPDKGSSSDGRDIQNDAYPFGKAIRFTRSSQFNSINSVFNNGWFYEITRNYLGPNSQMNLQTFASHEYLTEDEAGEWTRNHYLHFDPFRALKYFIYLTDTNQSNGAFRAVPGSHHECRKVREKYPMEDLFQDKYRIEANKDQIPWEEKDCQHFEGKAGTLLIFDTDIAHGGGLIKEKGKERMVIINHNR